MKYSEILEKVNSKLPALEVLISAQTGNTLNLKGKLKVKLTGQREETFSISSSSLKDQLGPVGHLVFSDINLHFWGGHFNQETNQIWFSPKVSYEHPSGGSNGTDILWESIWFDIETESWIPGRNYHNLF